MDYGLWTTTLLLSTFFFPQRGFSQSFNLINEIEISGKYLKIDNLGNTYVVNDKNELRKFNIKGEPLQFYNAVRYGKIGSVDVSNPLKPLVYFPSYNTIRVLDVTLSDKGKIALMDMGFDRVNAMCLSLDNHIWIYDEITFRLKKINDRLEIIQQSENLSTLLQMPVRPDFIMEKDNLLLLNDPNIGILVFDIYTTYSKTIPIKDLKEFQKLKEVIYYFKEGKLQSFHTKTLQFNTIPLPETEDEIIDVKIENNLLGILTKSKLLLYGF
jgi:hypothetical protein